MAAWHIRDYSNDVDLYVPEVPFESVDIVEAELRAVHGPSFRLDVTSGENVWGTILVRDIASSPAIGRVDDTHELRALSVEDLFALKLASARSRDLQDLDLLAKFTTADALIVRWNQLVKWHGDRHAILGFADALVRELVRLWACDPIATIQRLAVVESHRRLLLETFGGADAGTS